MRISTKIMLLAAAAAVLSVACSETRIVATVEESAIDEGSVIELRYSYAEGTGYDAEQFRGDLTNLILVEALGNAAEEQFGLANLDDPALVEAKLSNLTPIEDQLLQRVMEDTDRTEAVAAVVAEQLVIKDAVVGELVGNNEALLTSIYETRPEFIVEVCARHILVATSEEAEAVKVRLEAGEDFATVADEVSLDSTSPGGVLPCPVPAADYVPEFSTSAASLPIGEISVPVPTEFGWHIIVVDERTGPESVEVLVANPMAYVHRIVADELWGPWAGAAIQAATIEVASQVGTWAYGSSSIVAPPAG